VSRRNYVKYAGAAVVVVAGAAAGAYYATRPGVPPPTTETTGATSAPAETPPSTLKLAYDFAPCEAPFFVAITNKYFEAEGIPSKFEIFPCGSAAELRESIHSGNAILGYTAYEFIPAVDEAANFRYVMGMHTGCHEIFVSKNFVDQGIIDEKTLANYITTQKAAGKKVDIAVSAIGNSPYFFVGLFLAQNNLTFDDVNIVAYDSPSIPQAMSSGKVDISSEWDPIPGMVAAQGGKIILDPAVDAPYNQYYCCFTGMNHSFMQDYPQTALKVATALYKANAWVGENPRAAAEIFASYGEQLCPFTVEDLVTSLSHYDYAHAADKAREQTTLHTYADVCQKSGVIKHDADWIVANGYEHIYP
jgi:NitT/TauT family transport system substrate-binding protein